MNTETNKRIIEIDGVKIEVDLRTAKRVDTLRVGSRVKVLKKQYSDFKVHHGVIIGFEPFEKRPTIIIAYCNIEYSEAKIEYLYYHGKNEDIEVVASVDDDVTALDKERAIALMDKDIATHKAAIEKAQTQRAFFLKTFAQYWTPIEDAVAAVND